MKYTFNFWQRLYGRLLYFYGLCWLPLFKIIPFNMKNKFFVFVLMQFGGNCRNPYYEITQIEKSEGRNK